MAENILGPIIKQLRKQKNLTQSELGKMIGYSQNTVSNHENKKRALSEKGISKYAHALGTTPQELFMKSQNSLTQSPISYSYYRYYDMGLPMGIDFEADSLKYQNIHKVALADELMGNYAGDSSIFITRINGKYPNIIIPNRSLIAVKKINSWHDLKNGDLAIIQVDNKMTIKYYYYDQEKKLISFAPNADDNCTTSSKYYLNDLQDVKIIGHIISYTVIV
ncbi:XRE family transcriptional regulator [Bombilactobacillus bombi]|uniref:XRE family transcriptional regulator n=1 Tax=Bombilactobacillus bombi TaxID=1303590 RepID=UPI0015E5D56D|nr:XRE family transcriptional regulator [Bombilactobacillus bombi]MBA1434619.1 helix-turn-helix domain-containing protein [Bombilactobacillus bombi]